MTSNTNVYQIFCPELRRSISLTQLRWKTYTSLIRQVSLIQMFPSSSEFEINPYQLMMIREMMIASQNWKTLIEWCRLSNEITIDPWSIMHCFLDSVMPRSVCYKGRWAFLTYKWTDQMRWWDNTYLLQLVIPEPLTECLVLGSCNESGHYCIDKSYDKVCV